MGARKGGGGGGGGGGGVGCKFNKHGSMLYMLSGQGRAGESGWDRGGEGAVRREAWEVDGTCMPHPPPLVVLTLMYIYAHFRRP